MKFVAAFFLPFLSNDPKKVCLFIRIFIGERESLYFYSSYGNDYKNQ